MTRINMYKEQYLLNRNSLSQQKFYLIKIQMLILKTEFELPALCIRNLVRNICVFLIERIHNLKENQTAEQKLLNQIKRNLIKIMKRIELKKSSLLPVKRINHVDHSFLLLKSLRLKKKKRLYKGYRKFIFSQLS